MRLLIEHISFWSGIVASLLLALNVPVSGWAYILFIISNVITLYLLKNTSAPKVISYQIWFFLLINIVGIIRWLL